MDRPTRKGPEKDSPAPAAPSHGVAGAVSCAVGSMIGMVIFDHARTSGGVHDPGGFLRDGAAAGQFTATNPAGQDSSPLTAALSVHGQLPMPGVRLFGLSTAQLVLGLLSLVLVGSGLAMLCTSAPVAGVLLLLFGLVSGTVTAVSGHRRLTGLRALTQAWSTGWIRFAPARVGAVWHDHDVRHGPAAGPSEDRGRNQEVRHFFRTTLEVVPTDGSPTFRVTTAPFEALATRDGEPRGLRTAPGPLDAGEPEYSNGWTIVRYVDGAHQESATPTTNLSREQIIAGLAAAGIR